MLFETYDLSTHPLVVLALTKRTFGCIIIVRGEGKVKVYNKKIIVLSRSEHDGTITPLRIKFEDKNGTLQTCNIISIMKRNKRRIAGNYTFEILCEVEINKISRPCELRYNCTTAQWTLYKV